MQKQVVRVIADTKLGPNSPMIGKVGEVLVSFPNAADIVAKRGPSTKLVSFKDPNIKDGKRGLLFFAAELETVAVGGTVR